MPGSKKLEELSPHDPEAADTSQNHVVIADEEPEKVIEVLAEDDVLPPMEKTSEEKKHGIQNYGDYIKFGGYILFFMLMYESLMLPQVGMLTFMVYGAYSPQVTACGNHTFEGMNQRDICAGLDQLMNRTGCTPTVVTQFESVGHEVGISTRDPRPVFHVIITRFTDGSLLFGYGSSEAFSLNSDDRSIPGCSTLWTSFGLVWSSTVYSSLLYYCFHSWIFRCESTHPKYIYNYFTF